MTEHSNDPWARLELSSAITREKLAINRLRAHKPAEPPEPTLDELRARLDHLKAIRADLERPRIIRAVQS